VRLARDNARTCIKILLWPSLFELVGKIVILIGLNTVITSGHHSMLLAAGGGFTAFIGTLFAVGAELFLTLRQLALFRMFAGYSDSFKDAYTFVAQRKWLLIASVIATYSVTMVAIFFWCVVIGFSMAFAAKKVFLAISVTAALIGLIGLFVSVLLTTLPIMLIVPALALDQRPFGQMVGWCIKICAKTFWRTVGFSTLLTIVVVILSSVLNIPPSILTGLEFAKNYFGGGDPSKAPSLYLQIFASVWRSGANMILSPMIFFGVGFYYLDLRMRTEGLDITKRIEALSKPVTSSF
jgi:hypothetical protein